jgi:hypothetical protein
MEAEKTPDANPAKVKKVDTSETESPIVEKKEANAMPMDSPKLADSQLIVKITGRCTHLSCAQIATANSK